MELAALLHSARHAVVVVLTTIHVGVASLEDVGELRSQRESYFVGAARRGQIDDGVALTPALQQLVYPAQLWALPQQLELGNSGSLVRLTLLPALLYEGAGALLPLRRGVGGLFFYGCPRFEPCMGSYAQIALPMGDPG